MKKTNVHHYALKIIPKLTLKRKSDSNHQGTNVQIHLHLQQKLSLTI